MAINFKKKKAALVATLALGAVLAFGLAGCGAQGASSDKTASSNDKTITVAATPSPHAEILNDAVKPLLEKEGYTLEVKEFTDYVQPNTVRKARSTPTTSSTSPTSTTSTRRRAHIL